MQIVRHTTNKLEFCGINREDVLKPRPRYVVRFHGEGKTIVIGDNDGFVHKECDEPLISISNSLSSSNIYIKMSQIVEAAKNSGYEITCTKVFEGRDTLTPDDLYKLSNSVGLDVHQPVIGRGRVCHNCLNHYKNIPIPIDISGPCNHSGNVKLERYNDGMEYCIELESNDDKVIDEEVSDETENIQEI